MAKRENDSFPLSKLINEMLRNNKLETGVDVVRVKECWNNMMGPAISSYTNELHFKHGTLLVKLNSSVLREELSYGKTEIIKMLNEELKKEVITELILK